MWLVVSLVSLLGAVAAQDCPALNMTVPSAIMRNDSYYYIDIYLVRDESFEVYCTGDPNAVFEASIKLHRVVVNATTVKAIVEPLTNDIERIINCKSNKTSCDSTVWVKKENKPEINGFQCLCNNFESLTCSWNTRSEDNSYTLSLISYWDKNIIPPLYKGYIKRRGSYSCLWDLNNIKKSLDSHHNSLTKTVMVTVDLQICSVFDCVNHTNDIDLVAVTKLNTPEINQIHGNKTEAFLEVKVSLNELSPWNTITILYIVEYAFAGIKPRVLTTGTEDILFMLPTFGVDLKFPCPGKQYTVRISYRPFNAPPEFMSDYAYTSFSTEPDLDSKELDPICSTKPGPVETPPVLVYQDQLLRQEVEVKLDKFNELRMRLEKKFAEIKKRFN